jgi:hypothetical protein
VEPDDSLRLRDARTRYFEANGFGADGGYTARWVRFKFGRVPVAFPNLEARVRAVRFHDLHHVVTGYPTDATGESEISAWELASGCAHHLAAWALNLWALSVGVFLDRTRIFRAFLRGRHTRNLYRSRYDDALLDVTVGEMRRRLGLDRPLAEATRSDRFRFALWWTGSLVFSLATLALLLSPIVAIAWALG